MSSFLLYNNKGALNRESFNQLDIITNLSEKVQLKKTSRDRPVLVWVMRDFSLHSTKDPSGRVLDFLNHEKFQFDADLSAKVNEQRAERTIQRNKIRDAMKNSFDSLDCHYLPVPVTDGTAGKSFEEALQSLNKLNSDDLRPAFNEKVSKLIEHIGEKMKLKTVGGENLPDGCSYVEFVEKCIDKINTDSSILESDFEMFWVRDIWKHFC